MTAALDDGRAESAALLPTLVSCTVWSVHPMSWAPRVRLRVPAAVRGVYVSVCVYVCVTVWVSGEDCDSTSVSKTSEPQTSDGTLYTRSGHRWSILKGAASHTSGSIKILTGVSIEDVTEHTRPTCIHNMCHREHWGACEATPNIMCAQHRGK